MIEDLSRTSSTGGDIRTIDLTTIFPDPDGVIGFPGRWASRPFAILASSFKRVILSDADTVFLQDPSLLLQEPGFMNTGALFYRDRVLEAAEKDVYDWVDNILEEANATRLDEVKKDSAWFSRQTKYEMERYSQLFFRLVLTSQWRCSYRQNEKPGGPFTHLPP